MTADFLVSHFHTGPPKFMVQLVDPQTLLRIDVFPDRTGSIARAHQVQGVPVPVVRQDDMVAHKLDLLRRASPARPIDAKHRRDLLALGGTVPDLPTRCWAPDTYSTDLTVRCERCETSRTAGFPLAPKQAIFNLLGYV